MWRILLDVPMAGDISTSELERVRFELCGFYGLGIKLYFRCSSFIGLCVGLKDQNATGDYDIYKDYVVCHVSPDYQVVL